MTTVLMISLMGLVLAYVNRRDAARPAATVPDDIWAAFAEAAPEALALVDRPRTTVGGMSVGSSGFVAAAATTVDDAGACWLDAAAAVHSLLGPDRVAVRREPDGYHLQRLPGARRPLAAPPTGPTRIRVRIASLFE